MFPELIKTFYNMFKLEVHGTLAKDFKHMKKLLIILMQKNENGLQKLMKSNAFIYSEQIIF